MKSEPMNGMWGRNTGSNLIAPDASASEAAFRSEIKKDPSLGDINPLIHGLNPYDANAVEAVTVVAQRTIEKTGGVKPVSLKSREVFSTQSSKSEQRLVAQFEVDHLSREQIKLLEQLAKQTYGDSAKTTKNSDGKNVPLVAYPGMSVEEEISRSHLRGWYMGSNAAPVDSLHAGLFLYKDKGAISTDNFTDDDDKKTIKYVVEIREIGLYQTDLVEMIAQVSSILGNGKMLDHSSLLYNIYYDLMRLGLKKLDEGAMYGMDEQVKRIMTGLIGPLASPDLSRGLGQNPESTLLVGVPGTGKTLIAQELLQHDTGLFIVPLDPLELAKELSADKTKQKILPRISAIARSTGRTVILHVDDIEKMAASDVTKSTMLNLMAGVRDSGFYVIASTNNPEQIPSSLLQPGRFGIILYCGLQSPEARREILKIHANAETKRRRKDLFASDKVRDAILDMVVEHTNGFTPRFVAEIANVAKSNLFHRVALNRETVIGLSEDDLGPNDFFIPDDWNNAVAVVSATYNAKEVKAQDDEIRKFVSLHADSMGYLAQTGKRRGGFSDEGVRRLEELQAEALLSRRDQPEDATE